MPRHSRLVDELAADAAARSKDRDAHRHLSLMAATGEPIVTICRRFLPTIWLRRSDHSPHNGLSRKGLSVGTGDTPRRNPDVRGTEGGPGPSVRRSGFYAEGTRTDLSGVRELGQWRNLPGKPYTEPSAARYPPCSTPRPSSSGTYNPLVSVSRSDADSG